MIQAVFEKNFSSWRDQARKFILQNVSPSQISWQDSNLTLFKEEFPESERPARTQLTVSSEFIELAETISHARDEDRWELMYRILYRLQNENPNLLKISVDPDILRAELLKKSIRRDIHKMHAFVRFKKVQVEGQEVYVAWHKPEHLVVQPGASFFSRRFGDRKWSIFTPDESAHWDLKNLTFGPGIPQSEFQVKDDWDDLWKTYYKSIFNPARIKIKMMKSEMSPKYWASMPETELIPELVRESALRLQTMAANHNEAAKVDSNLSWPELKKAASSCKACPMHQSATETVFGEGNLQAEIMIVGEQPGDHEDQEGKPFVGPAGEILAEALKEAGILRENVYLTNAVKHFKWAPSDDGKARIHKKASGAEMHACKPWLEAELSQVKPKVILALGVTAGTSILGRLPKITQERGKILSAGGFAKNVILSWHPAAILRSMSPEEMAQRRQQLVDDLKLAKASLTSQQSKD